MATIDNLDLSIYNLYALRTRMIEQTNQQFRLDQAGSIPPQILVMDSFPKPTEIDLLLGVVPILTPWAYFFPPTAFRRKRRSPFGFARILPSLGDQDEQEKNEQAVASMECRTPEEEREKQSLTACFEQIAKINRWLSHIVGRVGQLLQG
ncbi:MAG: DUF5399 domain-containing protein [Parachlamydiaceae bacterium]|nr:DUF5399 domain-containing protein [Parachlamydiaceae bacterium]